MLYAMPSPLQCVVQAVLWVVCCIQQRFQGFSAQRQLTHSDIHSRAVSKPVTVAGGGEGQLLESVLKEELRFEAEEAARAHGGAGTTARAPTDGHAAGQVRIIDSYFDSRGGGGSTWHTWHTGHHRHK